MFIPVIIKYYFFTILAFTFGIIWINNSEVYYIVISIMFSILSSQVKCPSCKKPLHRTVSGWYMPPLWCKCDKCEKDLCKLQTR